MSGPSASPVMQPTRAFQEYRQVFASLLEDRRMMYRDLDLERALLPPRRAAATALLQLIKDTHPASFDALSSVDTRSQALTMECISLLRDAWLAANTTTETEKDLQESLHQFHTTLLASTFVRTDVDVRHVLSHMVDVDKLRPRADTFEIILSSLIILQNEPALTAGAAAATSQGGAPSPAGTVVGQEKRLQRHEQGDLAGYYFGRALAELAESHRPPESDFHHLWGTFLTLCALTQVAPQLMDLWWDQMCATDGAVIDGSVAAPKPLPYQAVHAAVAWSAANRDIERGLRYFRDANKRGVVISSSGNGGVEEHLRAAGAFTTKSTDAQVQMLQLRILAKLMATGKSVKMDGGLKSLVVRDVKHLIDPCVLRQASWGVINDLMAGLTMPSAMQLVKMCSQSKGNGDSAVPFVVWASLLRRCAREHYIDEAESLFLFIRKRFPLTPLEKRELIEIVMRMYASLSPPDYPSTMSILTEHVLRCPPGEPAVAPDMTLYNILIKAADSRNAAMMTFMESAAAGVGMDKGTFEGLLGSNPFAAVASLSRKVPHDYPSSSLDAQMRVPGNVDAHLRREEALTARGKPLYDSTGDCA